MSTAPNSFRQHLLAGACALVVGTLTSGARAADSTSQVNLALGQATTTTQSESVTVRAQKRLLKEKDSPSAVTELGTRQIQAVGIAGSTAQLLRQAPSVYVYQQGLGDNAPFLTIRGVRGLEVASTLDDVPIQDLLAPGSFYLTNNIGTVVTTNQINGVSIYPGVAYPDKNTFGTIGGTVAYQSKRPTDQFYFDVTGSVGSFGTYAEGFEANSGKLDSVLGTGDNAISMLLNYKNLQTQGYIDGTPSRENEMEFALDKPYNDGLSKMQLTVIYNNANGLIQNEPVPTAYLDKHGFYSNYPTNLDFASERNDYLTIIAKNDTYINDYLTVGGSVFYIGNNNESEGYADINTAQPNNQTITPLSTIGPGGIVIQPFINLPAFFGENGLYGPPTGGQVPLPNGTLSPPLGIYGGGYGGYFYSKRAGATYNPAALFPAGSKGCPLAFAKTWAAVTGSLSNNPCGLNDSISEGHSDTYGIQPRVTVTPPTYFGIDNTIKFGGLIAKETSPQAQGYLGAFPGSDSAENSTGTPNGGYQRTIFQAYIQDKIQLLDNTLALTPGVTVQGTYSSLKSNSEFNAPSSPYYGPTGIAGPNGYFAGGNATNIDKYGAYDAQKWDREYLPFFNVTYGFDEILPALQGLQAYGSFGKSALFAPVTDFSPNVASTVPNASIVNLYEGGLKYNVSNLLISADYFYQKVDRDFGFFQNQNPGPNFLDEYYTNDGQREFKGFEAAAVYQITPNWQLFGNVSHLLAKYLVSALASTTIAEDQFGVGVKGTPISGIPDWLSTFGVDYTQKSLFLDNDDTNIRFTGQYTGKQATTYDLQGAEVYTIPGIAFVNYSRLPNGQPSPANTQAAFLTGATTYDPHGGISPFAIFNLDAAYTLPTPQLPVLKKVTFDLNIQNLFDEKYFQYFYKQISPAAHCPVTTNNPTGSIYGCGPSFTDGIPGQPFTVFFTVTARF